MPVRWAHDWKVCPAGSPRHIPVIFQWIIIGKTARSGRKGSEYLLREVENPEKSAYSGSFFPLME